MIFLLFMNNFWKHEHFFIFSFFETLFFFPDKTGTGICYGVAHSWTPAQGHKKDPKNGPRVGGLEDGEEQHTHNCKMDKLGIS